MKVNRFVACCFAVALAAGMCSATSEAAPAYAEWAHHHLVWKSDGHHQQTITDMLKNYSALKIGVGALNVDSGWSTGYNNFVFDTNLFPDPKGLIDFVHGNGQRIVLWVTSMVDTDSSNYAEAVRNNFVFNLTMDWWHGHGRLLDFGNPSAVKWWEDQITTNLLDKYGCIDGWKCDGTDPWAIEIELLVNSSVTWPSYANDYYGFFLNFTRKKCGSTGLIMSRPSDCVPPGGIGHTGICPVHLPFAPRSVVFMGWVGDQDSTFLGLGVAYGNMMASAAAGYISFGSDTGGYRGNGPDGVAKDLFLRWAALNAMMPVMENGGDNRHCPWEFDDETVTIYRKLVDFHHSLVPYLYSNGLRLAQQPSGSLVVPFEGFLGHWLGPSFFAYPVLSENATEISFTLPNASSSGNATATGWYLFNTTTFYPSGSQVRMNVSGLDSLPFFAVAGSITVLYDLEGHPDLLFPRQDYPIVIHVYGRAASAHVGGLGSRSRRVYASTDGAYLGLRGVAVTVDEGRGAVVAVELDWAPDAERRKVSRCFFAAPDAKRDCAVVQP
jgi:alpha-glucosidase (family GH31 glycosyl hydrolase)